MNLPNKLTTMRIILIPFFMIFLLMGFNWVAAVIFIVASFTDFLDGHLARKWNLVSNFGKIMDPLADKLLVMAALICLVELGELAGWMAAIILARELLIVSLRAVAAAEGIVIAASKWGKVKTVSQMVAIVLLIIQNWPLGPKGFPLAMIIMWIAVVLTVISGVDYVVKNKEVFMG